MQINNFKKLQEEEEQLYREQHEQRVKSGLVGSLSAFRLVGQMIDMYLPKIFSLFVIAAGGRVHHTPPARNTTTPPSQIINDDNKDRRPGASTEGPIIR